jgi:hypothetical protein
MVGLGDVAVLDQCASLAQALGVPLALRVEPVELGRDDQGGGAIPVRSAVSAGLAGDTSRSVRAPGSGT